MAGLGLNLTLTKRSRKDVEALLEAVTPAENRTIWDNSLTRMAHLVRNNVITKQLIKGGGKVRARKLTNRTYNLRDNIHEDFTQLPRVATVFVGDQAPYGAIHEFGGTQVVAAHTRTIKQAFGKKLKDPVTFQVKSFSRTVPKRPFLKPALNATQKRFAGIMVQVIEEEINNR